MNKPQQTAALSICALGLLVLAIGAAALLSELKTERDRRAELEAEVTQLRAEIKMLKKPPMFWGGIPVEQPSPSA